MIRGYVRVSTADQNPERQIRKMRDMGISALYVDKASGKDMHRPEWERLLNDSKPGDSIVVDSLDRLGRNYADVTSEWRRLTGMGIDISCLDLEFFDSAKFREMGPVGTCVQDMLLSLLAYVAQTEREKNRQRQAEGIAVAKEAGKYTGRKPKDFDSETLQRAQEALSESKAAAARVLGVDRSTVYRMIRDGRLAA